MRLSVVICSRKRVRGLSAALTSLSRLESGKHEVTYGVCCDNDDPETAALCKDLRAEIPLAYRVGPRPETLGGLVNDMALRMPADVYVLLADDVLCLTYAWDDVIARAVGETPHGVFFWTSALPMDVTYPVITERWRAAAGCLYTSNHPFWYDDLALVEQYVMATDSAPRPLGILIADTPGKTHRMRDLKFWQDFFLFTRAWRVQHGREIARNLGFPEPRLGERFAADLAEKFYRVGDDVLAAIERNQGDPTPPDPSYLAAKRRAETVLALHSQGYTLPELFAMSSDRLWQVANEHPDFPA